MFKKKFLSSVYLTIVLSSFPFFANSADIVRILASTFPIYQITRNVTVGVPEIQVDLMLPANSGCPHDYVLTAEDMRKLASAKILVVNGLGMEEFLGAPLKKANPDLIVIDSSKGIDGLIPYSEHKSKKELSSENSSNEEDNESVCSSCEHAHHHHKHKEHSHDINPHLFVSPRMQARIAISIAEQLADTDKANAEIYRENAMKYAEKMKSLAEEFRMLGSCLKNNKVVQPHAVFDYLARDSGLEIVATMQAHGHEPSAAEILEIIKTVKEKKAGAILIEPQYPEKTGQTIAKECGIPVIKLDPGATGPENAPLDYYENIMRQNLKALKAALGE